MTTPQRRPEISPAQVAGSALAAVSAAFVASFLGVGGTVLGAALGSVVATIGGAVYSHSFRQAGEKLGETRVVTVVTRQRNGAVDPDPADLPLSDPADPVDAAEAAADETVLAEGDAPRRRLTWKGAVALAVLAFVLAIAAIEVAELVIGHPVSGGKGTTISKLVHGGSSPKHTPEPTPSPTSTLSTPTPTPTSTSTSTETGTASPTTPVTAPPTATTTAPPVVPTTPGS
jgi:hypothetical protein